MSEREYAALIIQKTFRGWLCRKSLHRQSHFFEIRVKRALPKRKPPIYRKKSRKRISLTLDRPATLIQKHIRGYLQRKRYKELYIEKMLKEQEDEFRSRILLIEKELNIQDTPATNISPSPAKKEKSSLYLELPLPMNQKKRPVHRPRKQVLFEYDYYILAATEIQKNFRGFLVRKKFGNFKKMRKGIIKVQRLYRSWKGKKEGQLELAAMLMQKQSNILSTSFMSYQHLKSLVLTQDRQGRYTNIIRSCEDKLVHAGVSTTETINSMLKRRIKELEQEKEDQENFYKDLLQHSKSKYKSALKDYLKGMKALKFSMEITQKSNFEHLTKLVRNLVSVSRDLENESFCENSTFLPDVSFTDKSSINFI